MQIYRNELKLDIAGIKNKIDKNGKIV